MIATPAHLVKLEPRKRRCLSDMFVVATALAGEPERVAR